MGGAFGKSKHNGAKLICFHTGKAHKATAKNFPVVLRRKVVGEGGKITEQVCGYLSRQACRKPEVQKKYLHEMFKPKKEMSAMSIGNVQGQKRLRK
jgi:hypothetical protein